MGEREGDSYGDRRRRLLDAVRRRLGADRVRYVPPGEMWAAWLGAHREEFPCEAVNVKMISDLSGIPPATCYRLLGRRPDARPGPAPG